MTIIVLFQCCHIHKHEANPFDSRQPKRLSFLKNLKTSALELTQPPIQYVLEIFPDSKITGTWFWLFCPYMPSQLVQGQFYLLPVSWYRLIPLGNTNSNYCTKYVFGSMHILHLFTHVIFKFSLTYKADTVQNVIWVMDRTVSVDFLSFYDIKF